ncbi:MAG TPA: DUF3106 domain-containing protein [Burkholderiaceae bacterium]|nr:DUF3106 domain-containing protein [Burkholderiaceae bacterium]
MRLHRAALILAVALASGAALAQTAVGSSRADWAALSAGQRNALAPLERDWSSIPPAQQQKWLEVANRYPSLPAEERARLTQRMTEWSRLSPQDRAKARLNFQEARQASRDDRQQHWADYNALPAEQRRALADRSRPAAGAQAAPAIQPPRPAAQPVGPMVVQRGAGATTNLVSKPPAPPLQQQSGLPKVVATPGFVEPATLLPQRGPQGAGAARRADADDKPKPKPKPAQ